MFGVDLLLVSHSLNLGTLELGFLHFKKILYTDLASMLSSSGYNICITRPVYAQNKQACTLLLFAKVSQYM